MFKHEHKEGYTDIFHISSNERLPIKLKMGLNSVNLLIEEFPLAEKYITQSDDNHWILETEVCRFEGVGRFVIGLLDDIEILGSDEFKLFLQEKVRNISKKIII